MNIYELILSYRKSCESLSERIAWLLIKMREENGSREYELLKQRRELLMEERSDMLYSIKCMERYLPEACCNE